MGQEKNIQEKGERRLKVYEKYVSRLYRRVTVFPEIRLSGKWLHDIGFHCGQAVTIQSEKNKIIITLDNKDDK